MVASPTDCTALPCYPPPSLRLLARSRFARCSLSLSAGGASVQTLPIPVWSRRSAILPEFVGYRFEVS